MNPDAIDHKTTGGGAARFTASIPGRRAAARGFTLIEMLTVLAIIGVLTALSIPAISKIRENAAVGGVAADVRSLKSQIADWVTSNGAPPPTEGLVTADVAAYGVGTSFLTSSAANLSNALRGEAILAADGTTEKYLSSNFSVPSSFPSGQRTNPVVYSATTRRFSASPDVAMDATFNWSGLYRLEFQRVNASTTPGTGVNFYLNGDAARSLPTGAMVASIVVPQVSEDVANKIATKINSEWSKAAPAGTAQTLGAVTYAAPNVTTGLTDVWIYVWHG